MKTVAEVILELEAFADKAYVYAYEGEFIGLVVVDKPGEAGRELGIIDTPPRASGQYP